MPTKAEKVKDLDKVKEIEMVKEIDVTTEIEVVATEIIVTTNLFYSYINQQLLVDISNKESSAIIQTCLRIPLQQNKLHYFSGFEQIKCNFHLITTD